MRVVVRQGFYCTSVPNYVTTKVMFFGFAFICSMFLNLKLIHECHFSDRVYNTYFEIELMLFKNIKNLNILIVPYSTFYTWRYHIFLNNCCLENDYALLISLQSLANQALRLRPEFTSIHTQLDTQTDNRLQWQYFDERAYVDKTRLQPGQDAYARHKFNQGSSDRLLSNRNVPDTRHHL